MTPDPYSLCNFYTLYTITLNILGSLVLNIGIYKAIWIRHFWGKNVIILIFNSCTLRDSTQFQLSHVSIRP